MGGMLSPAQPAQPSLTQPAQPSQPAQPISAQPISVAGARALRKHPAAFDILLLLAFCKYCSKAVATKEGGGDKITNTGKSKTPCCRKVTLLCENVVLCFQQNIVFMHERVTFL